MTITVDGPIEVSINPDEVIERMKTDDIIEYLEEERDVRIIVADKDLLQLGNLKRALEDICSLRTCQYLDRKTVKEVINEMIDDAFFA